MKITLRLLMPVRSSFAPSAAATVAAASLFFSGLALAQPARPPGETFRVVTVVEGLVHPWSMAFLPNGDMLVTEKPGRLRIVRQGKLLPDPVPGLPEIRISAREGLQDVMLHPDFESNRMIYLSYAKSNETGSLGTTALSRARFEDDRLVDLEEIFVADAWADADGHYASRIAFDREGYLFLSVGDRRAGLRADGSLDPDLQGHPAQDNSNHQGTIVRLHDDGRVPADNPFVGVEGARPEIWSFGHRNQQGLAVHPQTGQLWATEHGPQGGDELNHIRPGRNYGWPIIGYGANYVTGTEIHGTRTHQDMEQPAAFWVPSIAPSGLAVYQGDQFPNWQGNLFAGGLSEDHGRLSRVSLNGSTVIDRKPLLMSEYRIRDVREGPDGFLYLALDDFAGGMSEIIRLEPTDE